MKSGGVAQGSDELMMKSGGLRAREVEHALDWMTLGAVAHGSDELMDETRGCSAGGSETVSLGRWHCAGSPDGSVYFNERAHWRERLHPLL